jgi:CRISPR-associated protein Csm4
MSEFTLYRLNPASSFHLGEGGVGLEAVCDIIHSDTLFSALAFAWDALYGRQELEGLLQRFLKGDPPFLISSCFPVFLNTFMFPNPLLPSYLGAYEKRLKKGKFISKGIFEKMINAEPIQMADIVGNRALMLRSEIPQGIQTTSDIEKMMWNRREPPQVAVDRNIAFTEIYRVGEIAFHNGSGYYFLCSIQDNDTRQKLSSALRLLGDEGIGGERSTGRGGFSASIGKMTIKTPDSEDCILMSLYHPTIDEVGHGVLSSSFYQLLNRRGFIYSDSTRSLRKKSVRLIEEGSIIRGFKQYGHLVDVTPKEMRAHKVYVNGLAFKVPMRLTV